MGVSSSVRRYEISPGDHIYTFRLFGSYSHHGIYIGQNLVIHFTNHTKSVPSSIPFISSVSFSSSSGPSRACPNYHQCGIRQPNSGVVLSCLDCFLDGDDVRIYEYGVSELSYILKIDGSCSTAPSDSPETVIHRAKYLLQTGFGEYYVISNNCEEFAVYCKTGLYVWGWIGSSNQASPVDIGMRPDAVKIEVEELAKRNGWRWPDKIIEI